MKKNYTLLVFFLIVFAFGTKAQTDAISYQAVIINPQTQELPGIDAVGNILPNTQVTMRFTILNADASTAYQETQDTTTDAYGMVNLFIGEGNATSAQRFNEISWDGSSKELKVEIAFEAGGTFVLLGKQKLTFVPYAYHRDITASGDLTVDGNTNFRGDFIVEGQTVLNNSLTVEGAANLNNTLTVEGNTTLNADLQVNANVTTTGATTTADLVVGNEATINNLGVTGTTNLSNLTVTGNGNIKGNHVALFNNTGGGSADGVAIKIDKGTVGVVNNYLTFYKGDDIVVGRIESYDLLGGDLWESFPVPQFSNIFNVLDLNNVLTGGRLPSLSFNGGSLPVANFGRGSLPSLSIDFGALDFNFRRGSLPSLSFNPGSLPNATFDVGAFPTVDFTNFFNPTPLIGASNEVTEMVAWGMRNGNPGYLPTSPFQIAMVPVVLAAKQIAMNQGVIYGSKGADYAEWLEKENVEDKFVFGEVVGVKGGKISKVTEGADQVMSISLAPIVLGNMPDENRKEDFEKVGFMGQVPVLTVGDVEIGDYIVATGNNDGYAKAISANDITIDDLKNIIGKAWSSSNGQLISLINVSVGLKTNEWVTILKNQENRLNQIEAKLKTLEKLEAKVEKLSTLLDANNL